MSKTRLAVIALAALVMCLCGSNAQGAPRPDYGKVELIRDTWGIPHVFAETDEGAMYGLGWATAEDRAFQMCLKRRLMQGRLAETIGIVPKKNRKKGTTLDSDRMMRSFGFYRAAQAVAKNLDEDSKSLLQAYCDGVNDFLSKHPDKLSYLFKKFEFKPEPWTPADCVVIWWHMGQFFGTDGTRDYMAYRNEVGGAARRFAQPDIKPDDAAAVVKRGDVSDEWVKKLGQFLKDNGFSGEDSSKKNVLPEGPKFSHAWVAGKSKTTTKSTVLCSDPQTPVTNPSLFYEYHIKGKTFNARGIGVPGSPAILIGWTENVAWGMTALGADQADLFRLKTDGEHPGKYFLDGKWRDFEFRKETIKVRGGRAVKLTVRETHFGPVMTAWAFMGQNEGEVALKRIPVCETDRETIQGAVAMMRAKNAAEFNKALEGWRFPSANVIFGDKEGNIGYSAIGAIPLRSPHSSSSGNMAHDGSDTKYDWKGIVPHELMPQVYNPKRGYLVSGNHRPIESFYPIPIGISTGSLGDTMRSWRLRERLTAKEVFKPEEVLDIHFDSVCPARREIVRAGLHLRDVLEAELSPNAVKALNFLGPWYKAGASSDLTAKGAPLAMHLTIMFRFTTTKLTLKYGGGGSGLCYWLKSLAARLDKHPKAQLDKDEVEFVDNALSSAWETANKYYDADTTKWCEKARAQVTKRVLGFFESLDGFPSLDKEQDFAFPPLTCLDGHTIKSQAAQSYTQYVPMHDVDSAKSILPIGQSELKDSKMRWKTYEMWGKGELHPAPLSRKAVEKIKLSSKTLLSGKEND